MGAFAFRHSTASLIRPAAFSIDFGPVLPVFTPDETNATDQRHRHRIRGFCVRNFDEKCGKDTENVGNPSLGGLWIGSFGIALLALLP